MITHAIQKTWVTPQRLDDRMDAKPFQKSILDCIDKTLNCGNPVKKLGDDSITTFINRGVNGAVDNPTSTKLLKTRHVRAGYTDFETAYLPDEKAKRLGVKKLRKGDVLLTSTGLGTIGRAALFMSEEKVTVDNHVTIIRTKEALNGGFLTAFLNSKFGKAWTDFGTTGSTGQLELAKGRISELIIPLPPSHVQESIGTALVLSERCRELSVNYNNQIRSKLDQYYTECPPITKTCNSTWVGLDELSGERTDAWFHQRHFLNLSQWVDHSSIFSSVTNYCCLSTKKWNARKHNNEMFSYTEISSIDVITGQIRESLVPLKDAPSRAKKLINTGDILVSTVRPNRGAIAVVPHALDNTVATTGFAVLKPKSGVNPYFIACALRHQATLEQMISWNTGSTYPAIEEDVVLKILIPQLSADKADEIGLLEKKRLFLLTKSEELIQQSITSTEELINGSDTISSSRASLTWEDIEKELEGI